MKNLVSRLSRRLWFANFGFYSYRTPSALQILATSMLALMFSFLLLWSSVIGVEHYTLVFVTEVMRSDSIASSLSAKARNWQKKLI